MTNKQKNILFGATFVSMEVILIVALILIIIYKFENLWLLGGLIVLELLLIFFVCNLLPRMLDKRVINEHNAGIINERLVLNGKGKSWAQYLAFFTSIIIMVGLNLLSTWSNHPNLGWKGFLISGSFVAVAWTVFMGPFFADQILRSEKNTYTIEGGMLIIDEWAWFRKKTDHLSVPIADVDSVVKKSRGVLGCNLEISVAGIKRVLCTGRVGNQLYDELKRRMA